MSRPAPLVRFLGPATVVRAGVEIVVARPRRRAVLAALALRPDRVVRVPELVEAVWGGRAPASAAGNLHTYVSDLRAVLEPEGRDHPTVLCGHRDGYRLAVPPDNVDVLAFEALAEQGLKSVADGCYERGLGTLDTALQMWRGEPFAGTGGPLCDTERARLAEARLVVDEARFRALLHTDRPAEVVPDCVRLVREHPLREPLVALLAEALLRCGRPADALDELTGLRRRLRAELAADPGPDTLDLYQRILAGSLADPTPRTTVRARPAIVPAQLPHRFWAFTGREREVAELSTRVEQGVPVVLSGLPGIGKTALAVEIAHRMAPRFPDGQLFLDLRAAGDDPVSLDEALDYHLRVLGVSEEDMPTDTGDRIRNYRELIAGRRMLLVLDDAKPEHLSALTAGGASVTIATTRERSAAPVPGHPSALRELGDAAALAVLTADRRHAADQVDRPAAPPSPLAQRELTGRSTSDPTTPSGTAPPDRAALSEPAAVSEQAVLSELAALCGRVPLALRVMAARLAVGETPAELVAELRGAARPLDSFEFGGGGLRSAYDRSLAALPPAATALLDVLVAHPGRRFAADLVGVLRPDVATDEALDPLLRLGFLDRVGTHRFRVPDLVWHYAAERATAAPGAVEAAAERVVRWYASAADAVDRALDPLRRLRLPVPSATAAPVAKAGRAELLAWAERERPNLVRAAALAATLGLPRLAWHLAQSAEAMGAPPVELSTPDTGHLGAALRHLRAGRFAEALPEFRAEADLAADRLPACLGAAMCARETGAQADAVRHLRSALRLNPEDTTRAWALAALAECSLAVGALPQALESAAASVALWRAAGEPAGVAAARVVLASAHAAAGATDAAAAELAAAAAAFRHLEHTAEADDAVARLDGLSTERVS